MVFVFLLIYLFFFLLKAPVLAAESVYRAVTICATKLIPSLFPFLILNELIISSNLAEILSYIIGAPISKLFGIKKEGSLAVITGSLFGFPLGTKTASSLFEKRIITKEDAERLVCFCSNAGPALVIGMASSFAPTKAVAVCIYICQIASSVIIGILLRKNITPVIYTEKSSKKLVLSPALIPNAITSSVSPMLNVCAFVCFFSCISASVENLLSFFNIPTNVSVFIKGLLEITNGITNLQLLQSDVIKICLLAFFVGWSGLSVILQSINIILPLGLNYKKFVVSKLFQGILCAVLSIFFCNLFKLY